MYERESERERESICTYGIPVKWLRARVLALYLDLTGCVTLNNLLNLSVPDSSLAKWQRKITFTCLDVVRIRSTSRVFSTGSETKALFMAAAIDNILACAQREKSRSLMIDCYKVNPAERAGVTVTIAFKLG